MEFNCPLLFFLALGVAVRMHSGAAPGDLHPGSIFFSCDSDLTGSRISLTGTSGWEGELSAALELLLVRLPPAGHGRARAEWQLPCSPRSFRPDARPGERRRTARRDPRTPATRASGRPRPENSARNRCPCCTAGADPIGKTGPLEYDGKAIPEEGCPGRSILDFRKDHEHPQVIGTARHISSGSCQDSMAAPRSGRRSINGPRAWRKRDSPPRHRCTAQADVTCTASRPDLLNSWFSMESEIQRTMIAADTKVLQEPREPHSTQARTPGNCLGVRA